jgi:hypothetical protein
MASIVLLEEKHKQEIIDYLSVSPVENLKLISVISYINLTDNKNDFFAYEEGGEWQGVINFDWDISIYGTTPEAITAMAELALKRVPFIPRVVGKKETIDIFWETFQKCGNKLIFDRKLIVQILEKADFDFEGDYLYIYLAKIEEAEEVARLASDMNLEETGFDHLTEDPEGYMAMIKKRIGNNNYYILREEGVVKFLMMISYVSPYAVQIDEAYVVPQFRRQNLATRCIGDLCKFILNEIAPRVCGISHENNIGPLKYLKKLGFKPVLELRSVFMEE